jgi:hypothetical protein
MLSRVAANTDFIVIASTGTRHVILLHAGKGQDELCMLKYYKPPYFYSTSSQTLKPTHVVGFL